MYNVRLFDYPSGPQLRIYSSVVEQPEEVKRSKDTYIAKNPWGHEYVLVERMKEKEEVNKSHSIHSSLSRTVNTVYSYSRSNSWDWFVTLTFDPEKVDSFNYDECTNKLSKWLNNLRRICPDMKYLFVPEQHKSGRFHFHGLLSCCDELTMTDSGHKTKDGSIIYNIGNYHLGFSTATRVKDNQRVTKYISKYITKELTEVSFGKRRYWASKNLDRFEGEELILTQEQIVELKSRLGSSILHAKTLSGLCQSVTYLELSPDVDYFSLLKGE